VAHPNNAEYEYEDIVKEILFYFSEKVNKASLGINDLIIDPGFGFAKQ
jgi:dihydropteroate synthase